jgi:hypothetical protein
LWNRKQDLGVRSVTELNVRGGGGRGKRWRWKKKKKKKKKT